MAPRLLLLAAIFTVACKKSNPDPAANAGTLRFLPATAEVALRVDLTRARTWTAWQKASDAAFRGISAPLAAVKKACDLDLIAEARSLVFARGGDASTLVIAGLPKDKATACPGKLGTSVPGLAIVPDGERFGVTMDGKSFASGALLPSGELVIVSRKEAGIEAAAWATEVASGTGAAPAWWAQLDQTQPLALRVETPERTVTASAELGDPVVLRGKLVAPTAEQVTADGARAKAILEFLTKAEAGTGRLEPKGAELYADFTAAGPQIDKLLAAATSVFAKDTRTPEAPTGLDTSPIECSTLAGAVTTYMTSNLDAMPADQRAQAQPMFDKLVPALQKAYVDSCTAGAWAPAAIHCHVDSAQNLPRFEKCRLVLTSEQRAKFDENVKAVLSVP